MKYHRLLSLSISGLLMSISIAAASDSEIKIDSTKNTATALSIYNNNLAFIRDTRSVELKPGTSQIAFEGVAQQIQPESAMLIGSGITVLEQNYDYNLLTPINILNESIGKTVKTATTNPENGQDIFDTAEILNSNYGSPILKFNYGIETNFPGRIIYEDLPTNLRTKPTLVIELKNNQAGAKNLELAYLTNGLSWKADYIAEISSATNLTLNSWVTLKNESGADYKNAKVQLIAGSINQNDSGTGAAPRPRMMMAKMAMNDSYVAESAPMPSREAFSDYYLYTLPTQTTIKDQQSKQVSLMTANNVKFQKEYKLVSPLYLGLYGSSDEFTKQNPNVVFKLVNNKASNLGEPLPGGIIRFYEKDHSGNLQFIGESKFEPSTIDEKIDLQTGKAFDITAKGKILKNEQISKEMREISVEVKFDNAKAEKTSVTFEQSFDQGYTILNESSKSSSKNARTQEWKLDVAPNSSQTLTFNVRVFKK